MTCWTLRIEKACPSQNEFAWAHWRKAKSSKDAWKLLIRGASGFLDIPRARGKRRLTIERHARGTLDEQNLIGGAKGIIDDLVQLGLLVDDKPAFLELGRPVQARLQKGERRPYTLLILEEVA
nr:hypothetical protein [uncultured Holophaga sp.]